MIVIYFVFILCRRLGVEVSCVHIMWVVLGSGVCPADMVLWTDVGLVLVRRLRRLSGIDLAWFDEMSMPTDVVVTWDPLCSMSSFSRRDMLHFVPLLILFIMF